MLFIENTQPHLIAVTLPQTGTEEAARTILFRPGMNKIETTVWEQVRDLPLIDARVDSGQLKIALEGDAAEKLVSTESLSELHHKQAVKMVESTYEKATLLAWRNRESRAVVIRAIEAQLKNLDSTGSTEKEENEFI